MGTVTYSAHGGSSVMGGWDDVMPTAYEEVFALTKDKADGSTSGNLTIAGFGGNGLWRYDSPSVGGISFHAAYQNAAQTGNSSSYSDMGVKIAPEMLEGLEIGYATGEYDESATVLGVDVSTMYAKYTMGAFTVGYQQTDEETGQTSKTDYENTMYSVTFNVNDDLSIGYNHVTSDQTGGTVDAEATSYQAAYTMGGATFRIAEVDIKNRAYGTSAAADVSGTVVSMGLAF